MTLNRISRKYGWYLAKITASIENFKDIVLTSLDTINQYHLIPGKYIKITTLFQDNPKKRFSGKFILLPYIEELIQTYYLLKNIVQSFAFTTFHYADKEYINKIIKLMYEFYPGKIDKKGLKFKEIFEFDTQKKQQMNIAISESWLNEYNINLGEIVLLRNDIPSSVVL